MAAKPAPPARSALGDAQRLADLRSSGLLDSPAEEAFDRFTRLVVQALGVPVSLVSLVDAERQFFKSEIGLPEPWSSQRETGLAHSFCQHVVAGDAPLVVTDARTDDRVQDNLAVQDLAVVGYAGVPVHGPSGLPVGALCAITHEPRAWTDAEVLLLQELADAASEVITMRARAVEQRAAVGDLSHQLRTSLTALRLEAGELQVGDPQAGARVSNLVAALTEHSRALDAALRHAAETTTAQDSEIDVGGVLHAAAARARPRAEGASRRVLADASTAAVTVVAPQADLAELVDGMVAVLLEHGCGDVRLRLVPDAAAVRVRVSDDSNGLPAQVSAGLSRRSDSAGPRGEPSLAERASRCRARLVQTGSRPTTLDLLLPRG